MTRRPLPLALLAVLAVPSVAFGAGEATPPPEVAVTPPPATVTVVAERTGAAATVLTGTRVRLRGVVRPYAPGQTVTVRGYQGGRKVLVKRKQVDPGPAGTGTFVVGYAPRVPGTLLISASHAATAQLGPATSVLVKVDVLPRAIAPGATGRSVRLLQRRLRSLGYVVGASGRYDDRTARAVLAFRKQTAMARVASADAPFFRALARGAGAFRVRYPGHGRHVEADLTHQTLALVGAGGRVQRIYPISSGKPSTPTVLGSYRIYRKDYGINAKGMVDASYFYNGYAIHGFAEVPTYPASHGCLRAPVPEARSISDWLRRGTIVDVFYRGR